MKRLKMNEKIDFTFEECCNKYLENCRVRNLREATIKHYRQSCDQFYKFFQRKCQFQGLMRVYIMTMFYFLEIILITI